MITPVGSGRLDAPKDLETRAEFSSLRQVGDTIQPKEDTSFVSKIGTSIKTVFHWMYIQMRLLVSKVFFCFDSLKLSETLVEKYQKVNLDLEATLQAFKDRAKRSDLQELRKWWRATFENHPRDIRKMLILEDVKSYASDPSNKTTFAEENYSKYHSLAQQFVRELETIEGNDPLEYVPGYIQNVIDIFQAKIKVLEEKAS